MYGYAPANEPLAPLGMDHGRTTININFTTS